MVPALGGLTQRDTAPDNLAGLKAKESGRSSGGLPFVCGVQRHRGSEMFRLKGLVFPVSV